MKYCQKFVFPFKKNLVIISIVCAIPFFAQANNFYVSVNGSDSNAGTKEKPFASLERAKDAVQISMQKKGEGVYSIFIDGGSYHIEKPIVFESAKFGGNNKIIIKALTKEKPVISGGKLITSWKKNNKGIWVAQLPKNKNWNPRELFIGGERATRARFPNQDYLRVEKVGNDRRTNFFFEKGDFPIPENVDGVELILLHDWSISRIGVKEIDSGKNNLIAVDSIGTKSPDFFNLDQWEKNPRYYLENAMEFLDADYEWYFSSVEGNVYLKLPENENPETSEIVVPFAESLIQIKGNENKPIKNIHFEGITFRHCNWQIPDGGYCGVQACYIDARPKSGWTEIPSAIKVEWAESCSFTNCAFENLGASAVWLSTACQSCSIKNSHFNDISGNGIMIGEGRDRFIDGEVWWQKAPEQVAKSNMIENCTVTKCGAQFYGAIGIWCGFTANTTIKNNEIYELPYSGISIGWEWSPNATPCRENLIEGNHIHHIMQILSDGGGIYMLGLQPGSKILNNHIHDVEINAGRAESNGMFLDEGITDLVVANNLIYNIAKSPLRFHKATTNLVKDNYLFCTDENPPIRYNATKEEDIKKVDNKVYSESDEDYLKQLKTIIQKWKNR
ncbi:MAG: right-handed parallel beta-helix repeat-containing protein [Bacteroidetes bacterium]|nr:right-handed parallel beta-helix repeat-containing protein [Bacteroidota bacterium]